ncbi:MAG: cyclase [Anaerolineales bacterium]
MTDPTIELLETIGPGRMPPVPYDTAWVARLVDIDSCLSNEAMGWLCAHQLSDGAWGAESPFYYHDRVICTLAAMIALARRGRRSQDRKQIELGQQALERICEGATAGLAKDVRGATVGFEMIAPTLVAEAERLGLIKRQGERILGKLGNLRAMKRQKLQGGIHRYSTVAFSAEMAGEDFDMLNLSQLTESNGSVGCSPAATAYYVLMVKPGDSAALSYLKHSRDAQSGGVPNVAPFDVFEVAWTLWNLALTWPEIRFHPAVKKHVSFLERAWQPGQGTGFAADYSVRDGDDTGLVFETLKRYETAVDIDAVLSYEEPLNFRCYPLEANPSTSAHAHILGALRASGMDRNAPPVSKAIHFLERARVPGGYWHDKWHISPYYVTSHIVIACAGFAPELVLQAVHWLLDTQNKSGAWGMYTPTAEETAYCIQALWAWSQHHPGNTQIKALNAVRNALLWLKDHVEPPYPPLWIGKCLYCPENVIRSAVLSALNVQR